MSANLHLLCDTVQGDDADGDYGDGDDGDGDDGDGDDGDDGGVSGKRRELRLRVFQPALTHC